MATADHWLAKLSRLRVDRAKGDPAPHKPLLLLVVADLAQEEALPPSVLPLTPELAFRFASYWSVVAHRRSQKPDIRLPFHHLAGDGIWTVMDESGSASPDKKLTRFAKLPSDFVAFLADPSYRDNARQILIAKFFPASERIALYEAIGMKVPTPIDMEEHAAYKSPQEARAVGREARFRIHVVAAYNYTCALTGCRLTTISSGSLVDAAHIHEFADSRNNAIDNGIALSKNAHWSFDQGLWTISDEHRVIVAVDRFSEAAPEPAHLLRTYHAKPLYLPNDRSLWPSPVHLAWHRSKKFQGF